MTRIGAMAARCFLGSWVGIERHTTSEQSFTGRELLHAELLALLHRCREVLLLDAGKSLLDSLGSLGSLLLFLLLLLLHSALLLLL